MTNEINNQPGMFESRNVIDSVADPAFYNGVKAAGEEWRVRYNSGLSEVELRDLIGRLNTKHFGPYFNEPVRVTGLVEEIDHHRNNRCSKTIAGISLTAENLNCHAGGFVAHLDEYGDYSLRFLLALQTTDEDGKRGKTALSAPLDTLVTSDMVFSEERVEAVLETYIPELITEIDDRVLNKSSTFCEALSNLKNLDLSELEDVRNGDEENYTLVKNCFINYLNRIMDIDNGMPYIVSYHGSIVFPHRESIVVEEDTTLFIDIHRVLPAEVDGQSNESSGIKLVVECEIRRPDPNNDEKASLYVDHIDSPASTREALYSSE